MSQHRVNTTSLTNSIPAQAVLQIVDLDKEKPLFKLGDGIYEGTWEDMVGTELFTDLEGRVFGKTRTRIHLRPGQLRDKSELVGNDVGSYWTKRTDKKLIDRLREITIRRKAERGEEEESDSEEDSEDSDSSAEEAEAEKKGEEGDTEMPDATN